MSRGLHELQQFPFMKGEPPYWLASASHVMSALMCIDWEFPETTPLSDAIQSVNPLTVNGIAVAGIWLDLPLGLFRSVFHSLFLSFFVFLRQLATVKLLTASLLNVVFTYVQFHLFWGGKQRHLGAWAGSETGSKRFIWGKSITHTARAKGFRAVTEPF